MTIETIQAIDVHAHFGTYRGGKCEITNKFMSGEADVVVRRARLANTRLTMVSPMAALGTAMVDAAGNSVTLAIGLVGVMALFLGLMKVAEAGGLLTIIAKVLRPLMVRAFPEVPANHPAMGAMILNLSANALGLANAATPFGIRAMQELDDRPKDYGTYQKIIEDPGIDVVIVSTPDHLHARHIVDALKAGKDVCLEKPTW